MHRAQTHEPGKNTARRPAILEIRSGPKATRLFGQFRILGGRASAADPEGGHQSQPSSLRRRGSNGMACGPNDRTKQRKAMMNADENRRSRPEVQRLTYNASEVCEALGVSQQTLWRIESRGLLPRIPGIRHRLYAVTTVMRFVEGKAKAA